MTAHRLVSSAGESGIHDLGPFIVGIYSHGNSYCHDFQETARKRLENIYASL